MKPRKPLILFVFLMCFGITTANAQISEKQLQPFIPKGYTLASTSGDGLTQVSSDILLELVSEEVDENETLLILRNEKGKLKKVAENSGLLMGKGMLGISGGNYPSLSGNILSIDYSLGSGSAASDISIVFTKEKDGNYKFKEYTLKTNNHGVENLKARQKITAAQTGKIIFSEASENLILEKSKRKTSDQSEDIPPYKAQEQFARNIPEGYQLAAYAEGDLNLDELKKDLVLVIYDGNTCSIRLLLQHQNGDYKTIQINDDLITEDRSFNPNNLKIVIKNGYFTIEQKMATNDENFDQNYITFNYDEAQKNWFLHRFDVEHYFGFETKPSKDVTHLTTKEFGTISFSEMKDLPGVYYFEPVSSMISGTITKKQFYGIPNYGETPEADEKV